MNIDIDLLYTPAHELAERIAAGQLSAFHLVSTAIARAREMQSRINCIAIPTFNEALDAARKADAAVERGDRVGPLHGIPITIKDGVATSGHRLTFGSASCVENVAQTDDPVWRRLKDAGAILIAKTTTPEFFHKVVTDSPLYDVTRNPWSLAHSPGGSSGGAAAALAAGIGPIAVGSDGGGSLRCPASCTGVLGLKPTMGRVPHAGFPDTFSNYATIGPMARDVRDLSLMLSIMSGEHANDAASIGIPPFSIGSVHSRGISRVRVGWIADPGGYGVEPEVARIVGAALDHLSEQDIDWAPIDGSFFDGSFETYRVVSAVGHSGRARSQSETMRALWTDSFRAIVERGLAYRAVDIETANADRTKLFRSVQAAFETVDVIATPTLTSRPKSVTADGSVDSREYAAWAAALYLFNLTGHPGISVPCGLSADGLPIGIQFVAPWYHENVLLSLAGALEAIQPWTKRRPDL